jgi:hypothetical protein
LEERVSFADTSCSDKCHCEVFSDEFIVWVDIEGSFEDADTSVRVSNDGICPSKITKDFRVISHKGI